MDFDINKETVCINKLICKRNELIFIEEDMIVPDSKPDILNAINLCGNVCIYKKEVLEGKIKVDGCINTYIMYLPDSQEDNLRGLNATIDFSKIIQIPEIKEGMDASICVEIKDLECKVINGRKINIRVGLEFKVKVFSNEEIEVISEIDKTYNVQTLDETFTLNSLIGKNSTRVYVKDTLNVEPQDEIAEILKTDINIVDSDVKISYNKVLAKSEIEIKLLYLTEDNRIGNVEGKIPAVGFIDMQNVTEENICDIENQFKNILIKPNPGEEHSIYVEIELETTCTAFEKKELKLIQDLYSPTTNLNFEKKKVNTTLDKMEKVKNFTLTSKTNIPELSDGYLIGTQVTTSLNKEQLTDSKLLCEGEVSVNFIFANSNNRVNSKTSKIPFEFSIDNPLQNENANVETTLNVIGKKFEVKQNGDIECTIDIEAKAEFSDNKTLNIIENIGINEETAPSGDYDSLIIYIVQKGDSLWKIAKKFRSTIDEISRVNGIEDEAKIYPGQKIYIPKFNYNNIKGNTNE